MSETKIMATTHYGDFKGTVSVDKDDLKNPFSDLAKDNGIDLEKSFLLSVAFKSHKGTRDQYVIFDTTDVALNYDDVKRYLEEHGSIPVERFSIDMSIDKLLEYTKNFSFIYTFNDDLIGQDIHIKPRIEL